jgi:predicted amidohydrolase
VIDPRGVRLYRQAKIQLVEGDTPWARAGNRLAIFHIDDIVCSLIVCHDSRYPELVRLPVMKGARLIFYPSWEADIGSEAKLNPYRAQVQARAVENNVYVVQANAPQRLQPQLEGSHGQSRIVDPQGNLVQEASMLAEEILTADLDMSLADGERALKSWRAEFLKRFWQAGLDQIGEIP